MIVQTISHYKILEKLAERGIVKIGDSRENYREDRQWQKN